MSEYPDKLGLDEKIDHSKHYIARCQCHNCNKYYGAIKIKKGQTVDDCRSKLVCNNCEIKGMFIIW